MFNLAIMKHPEGEVAEARRAADHAAEKRAAMLVAASRVIKHPYSGRRTIVRYCVRDCPDPWWQYIIACGLGAWAQKNPRLVFVRCRRAPLVVKFGDLGPDKVGCASMGTFPRGVITLDAARADADTVAHEFGHIVGYGHHGAGVMRFRPKPDPPPLERHQYHSSQDRDYYEQLYSGAFDMYEPLPDMRKARRFRLPGATQAGGRYRRTFTGAN